MAGLVNFEQFKAVVRQQQNDKAVWQQEYATKRHQSNPGREICTGIGVASTNTVSGYLDKLVDAHMITKRRGHIRVIGATWKPPRSYD